MSERELSIGMLAKNNGIDCSFSLTFAEPRCILYLRMTLDHIEKMVSDDDGILNDLGELQLQPGILDCRIASLATVRSLRNESK